MACARHDIPLVVAIAIVAAPPCVMKHQSSKVHLKDLDHYFRDESNGRGP